MGIGLFTGVKSLFQNLTSTHESVNTVTKGIYNGLDKAFFTDEERSVANQKILDFELRMAEATAPQNRARRLIAVEVTRAWFIMLFITAGFSVFGTAEAAKQLYELMLVAVTPPFTIIVSFYFYKRIRGDV